MPLNTKRPGGGNATWNAKFEGIINNLMRRYQQTESEYIRKEIEQYMVDQNCAECKGYRLKDQSLAVSIRGQNIMDITSMSVADAEGWITGLAKSKAPGKEALNTCMTELFQFPGFNSSGR